MDNWDMDEQEQNPSQMQIEDMLANKVRGWHQSNPKATLTEIEEMVDLELAKVRKQLVEIAFEEDESEKVTCPACGYEAMSNNGKRERQLQIKGGETVAFARQQKRCPQCGATHFPP